jgi:hypothetical protein
MRINPVYLDIKLQCALFKMTFVILGGELSLLCRKKVIVVHLIFFKLKNKINLPIGGAKVSR